MSYRSACAHQLSSRALENRIYMARMKTALFDNVGLAAILQRLPVPIFSISDCLNYQQLLKVSELNTEKLNLTKKSPAPTMPLLMFVDKKK